MSSLPEDPTSSTSATLLNWFELLPDRVAALSVIVDGGATGSRAAAVDPNGEVFAYGEGGPTNARAVGDQTAISNAVQLVAQVRQKAGVARGQPVGCLLASAAVDTREHAHVFARAIASAIDSTSVTVVPDTLACWAAVADLSPATAVISGTGSVVFTGDIGAGVCSSFGIGDFLLGDGGSAFGIARAALREAIAVGEGRSSNRALAELCLQYYSVASYKSLPDCVYKPSIDKARIAGLAREVLRQADAGVRLTQQLVSQQADCLASVTVSALAAQRSALAPLGCFGGVFRSDSFFKAFSDHLASRGCPEPVPRRITTPALGGAFRLLYARVEQRGEPLRRAGGVDSRLAAAHASL